MAKLRENHILVSRFINRRASFLFWSWTKRYHGPSINRAGYRNGAYSAKKRPEAVLGEWDYRRTSNPESELLKSTQKQSGFNEPTATVMWNTLARHELSAFDTILWNIFSLSSA